MFFPGQLFIYDNTEKFCFINLIHNFIIDSNIKRSRSFRFSGEYNIIRHLMKVYLLLAIVF